VSFLTLRARSLASFVVKTSLLHSRYPLVLVLAALSAGCTESTSHPALEKADLPPLLQAHRFTYRVEAPSGHRISPDGRKLAWTGPSLGRRALFVRDLASGGTRTYRAAPGDIQWTADGRWLLFTAPDTSGKENSHVHAIDTDATGSEIANLTPYPGVRANIHVLPPANPRVVFISHNRRDARLFDLYRVDLATRAETLVGRNPGDAIAPITDREGALRGWNRSREARRAPEEKARPAATRRPLLVKRPDETFRVLGTARDGSSVWALSDRGRERVALVEAHPTLGWEKVVFEDPAVDVSYVEMSRVTRAPLVAAAHSGNPRFEILDAKLKEDLAPLLGEQGREPFWIQILSTDAAERRIVVAVHTAHNRRFYLVDRPNRTHALLGEALDGDLAGALAPVEPIAIESRDGLRLHGYLTLPRGVAAKGLPMVLHVHGGPWMRTAWGDPIASDDAAFAQFLANRGYAVLQIDYRGSTGYGRAFRTAGLGEFAGRMHEDLLDAVRWAVERGTADPKRIAIMGWSYGGYAALVGLTHTPDVFACGISINGPTDLATLIESFPPYWSVDLTLWHDYVGNPAIAEDREEMTRKSPLTFAAQAVRPALIVHGARDVRVRIDQSERMVAALRAAGKPVEYLRIEDMGHGMSWWVHKLAVLRRTEAYLADCLGGRASRFDPWEAAAWVWTRVAH